MNVRSTALALVCALACGWAVGVAGAEPLAPSSFGESVSSDTAKQLTVEIPLVRAEHATLVIANTQELNRVGVLDHKGPEDADYDESVLGKFAFRPATAEEIAAGKATHIGIATRYHDAAGGVGYGHVVGDGRAALLGDVVVKDAKTNKIVGIYDIQAKGIATGLRPVGTDTSHPHATGHETLVQALHDMFIADYLHENGIRANKWLAVIDLGKQTIASFQKDEAGHYKTTDEHIAVAVRGGNFLRIAHSNYFRSSPAKMRELFDFVNAQLSAENGRSRPYSWEGLYKELTARKAGELSQLYWARMLHGSITYDNVGFLEAMDFGTSTALDRVHPTHPGYNQVSTGIANEAQDVLRDMYAVELKKLMHGAARTSEERTSLARVDGAKLATAKLREQMAGGLLAHLGFDDDDVHALMKHDRAAILGPGGLLDVVRAVGETAMKGETHQMGPSWSSYKDVVKDPARYDLFAALGQLVAVHTSARDEAARIAHMVAKLDPLGETSAEDRAQAKRLLDAAGPIIDRALSHLTGAPRAAKAALVAAQAEAINFEVTGEQHNALFTFAHAVERRLEAGEDVRKLREEIRSHMRANRRSGPQSPAAVAMRLRRGQAEPVGDGFYRLGRIASDGVELEEVSNGARDQIRVQLHGDPLKLNDPSRYRMYYTFDNKSWTEVSMAKHEDGATAFHVDLPQAIDGNFQVWFRDGEHGATYSNGGANFGRWNWWATASPMVQAELALLARKNGLVRDGVSEDTLKAAAARAGSSNKSAMTLRPIDRQLGGAKTPGAFRRLLRDKLGAAAFERRKSSVVTRVSNFLRGSFRMR